MKILKIITPVGVEEYYLGQRPLSMPQEFVKDIIYKDGNFTVVFCEDGTWFKTFNKYQCEYTEFGEMKTKSNKDRLQ